VSRPTGPNVLLLCTDQQRYDALGAQGNEHIATPNLDRLAAQGVRFDNCYVQNPVCAPSRASLMTSRYVHAHGLWANGVSLPATERIFTRDLADAGYDCGLIGKFHLAPCIDGREEQRHDDGFRVFRWAHDPGHDSPANQYHRWLEENHPLWYADVRDPASKTQYGNLPAEAHLTRWTAEETISFLRDGRDENKPFFCVANFFDPHHPFDAPPEYLERYDPRALPEPIGTPDELDTKPEIYTEASKRSYAGHAKGFAEYTPDEVQQAKAAYYAMVEFIDDEVGRILDVLDELGLADDTIVVFTSDHGEMLGDHRLMLKGPMMFDCAVRVPLLMRWPGVLEPGAVRDELVQWIDLAPTFLEAAGLPPMPAQQGQSLLPLLRGEVVADGIGFRDWALSEHRNSSHPYDPPVSTTMLRHDRWKVVVHHGAPVTSRARAGELYDLLADPDELVNLWDDPAHTHVRLWMQEKLLDVLVATEDRSQPREGDW
jgi:arylsulfatase